MNRTVIINRKEHQIVCDCGRAWCEHKFIHADIGSVFFVEYKCPDTKTTKFLVDRSMGRLDAWR